MKYHNITKADMLNGEGLRVVLWVSGCSHHCPGCHNAVTWDPNDGLEFDEAAKKEIFDELEHDWCSGITLSGGDPLYLGNRKVISELVCEIRSKFKDKSIWLYTGYTWDVLLKQAKTDKDLDAILKHIDVLLDGKFVMRLASVKIEYVGSSNQCIIDVKKSLKSGKKVLYIDNSKILEGEEV